jgi:hypothetical protein
MTRTLLIIFGAATILCIAAFGGAAALGGADLQRHGWNWTFDEEDGISIGGDDPDLGPESTREIAWSGGDELVIDVPGEIVFTQGDEASVRLSGPQAVLDRVTLVDGRLGFKMEVRSQVERSFDSGLVSFNTRDKTYWPAQGLKVSITAPDVRRFRLLSKSELTIQAYDQDSFTLAVAGAGDVTAAGRTRDIELDISGSGDVDLSDLSTTDARVDISGSGDATLAPTGEAAISISGSGDVDLTTRPARLTQDITGSGDVDERG